MVNVAEAERALVEKPMLATSAERVLILNEIMSKHKELPQPMRFAAILSELLERVSVPLEDYDLIAGRCVDRLLTEEEEAIFQQFLRSPDNVGHDVFLGSGHCTYDWKMLVEEGLPGLRRRTEEKLREYPEADKQAFLNGILGVYSALEKYMLRYAQAAQERGMEELAGALRRAATERPSDFRAALQLLWIVALMDCAYITPNPTLTVGRMDLILYPLYEKDVRAGCLTRDEARALIIDYYCKHNLIMGCGEHQVGDVTNSTTFHIITQLLIQRLSDFLFTPLPETPDSRHFLR